MGLRLRVSRHLATCENALIEGLQSPVRIISVKVVNDQGRFDDDTSIADQMEAAMRALHQRDAVS